MKNTLKLNHDKSLIVMDRTFAKKSQDTRSEEYTHLQQVRKDYPNYTVIQKTIKKNPVKNSHRGLTYEYMRNYILAYTEYSERQRLLDKFDEMIVISKCQGQRYRYPVIKKWFLTQFRNVKNFPQLADMETILPEPEADIKIAS